MKIDLVSEKVILSSIAASVALTAPYPSSNLEKNAIIDHVTIDQNKKYSFGDSGIIVKSIQHKLLDYDLVALEEDGVFSLKTHAAIRKFQKMKQLHVDGVAGPETLAALFINKNIAEVEVEDHILISIEEGQFFKIGDNGQAVKEIQRFLKEAGYYHYEKDGKFGPITKTAVKGYQKDHGLIIDGIVGPQTYKHLSGVSVPFETESQPNDNFTARVYANTEVSEDIPSPVIVTTIEKAEKNDLTQVDYLHSGDTGQAVKDLQSMLKNKGFYHSAVDGSFGPRTEAAVRNFQIQNGIKIDGIAGPQTLAKLKTAPVAQLTSRSIPPSTNKNDQIGTNNSIINVAKNYIGTRYVWGGTSPNGFDCSGYLMYVFNKSGISIPRTVADIWNFASSVQTLQPGDIVFYETYKKGPSHAGIYLGNNQFIHASLKGVEISDMTINYWKSRYLGAKRIKN